MKKSLFYMFLVLAVVASVAYARRGRPEAVVYPDHPLQGYADQIVTEPDMDMQGAASEGLNLFD